ncbi:protein-export chaperone SecB [Acidisoma cellulosilytica]|uniref:Protein-export protein SecB n=1 Tax=Acidisoma cellulosilyticum TaxID=2802395 RepID=A0A963YXT9_9PROT|nr:protein-export chaperone SecB [Acidisoma cellulosilyticum]MCB8879094.1 protein-export chaperone SecB [Acidisoma cellulosilyticum]
MSQQTPEAATAQPVAAPLVVNAQYVKDLSFEVPGAPQIYSVLRSAPQVAVNLDVQVKRLAEDQLVFEVTLVARVEATKPADMPSNGNDGGPIVFLAELSYAGIFTLNGIPDNQVEPVLMVEGPRLLFPFARNILADVTRDGGFPPVLLGPIDFLSLWQHRRSQAANAATATPVGNA